MKMIKVIPNEAKVIHNRKMWVKETNPYFQWYKDNPNYKVTKEVEI